MPLIGIVNPQQPLLLMIQAILFILFLLALPLAGIWLFGHPVAPYLAFPPQTTFTPHAPFSWPVFLLLAFMIATLCGPFLVRILGCVARPTPAVNTARPFPWWGYAGVLLTAIAWILAWNRFSWFQDLQPYTFLPLWLGYILTVNGLTARRSGSCMLAGRPRYFLSLFPLSALFWWFFEYLNRFAQNWHYMGIANFSAPEYVFQASLCFSTVLPAVLGTEEYLATFPCLQSPLTDLWPIEVKNPHLLGWLALALATGSLFFLGRWPDYLFPVLWTAPLLIIVAFQVLRSRKTIFSSLPRGDWRPIWLPALAALLCGFFWEMWNVRSLAHWEYSVPFVGRFHIFKMPLLGYAGYLPFGLECRVVADMLRSSAKPSQTPLP